MKNSEGGSARVVCRVLGAEGEAEGVEGLRGAGAEGAEESGEVEGEGTTTGKSVVRCGEAAASAAFLMAAMARRRLDDFDMMRLPEFGSFAKCSRPLPMAARDKTGGAFCPVGASGLVKSVDGSAGGAEK